MSASTVLKYPDDNITPELENCKSIGQSRGSGRRKNFGTKPMAARSDGRVGLQMEPVRRRRRGDARISERSQLAGGSGCGAKALTEKAEGAPQNFRGWAMAQNFGTKPIASGVGERGWSGRRHGGFRERAGEEFRNEANCVSGRATRDHGCARGGRTAIHCRRAS